MSLNFWEKKGIEKRLKATLESEKTRMCFVFCLRRDGKFEVIKLVTRCLEHLDAGDQISKLFKNLISRSRGNQFNTPPLSKRS